MKKTGKRVCLLLLMVILSCSVNRTVFASGELPDLRRPGSISILMKNTDTGKIVPDGSLALCRVAEPVEQDGYFTFRFTDDFADCGLSLEDVESEKLASDLVLYAADREADKMIRSVGTDGRAVFTELEAGLYLIMQQTAAAGYSAVNPFLVSIPMQQAQGEGWLYDVDASPKAELKETQSPPQNTQTAAPPSGTKLPQTGQLNWPVPVMAVAGMLFFALGWRMNSTKNGTKNSTKGKEQL